MEDVRPKVLLVDDKKENLLAMEELLSEIDIDIVQCESGEDALSKVLKHEFALILLDVEMPGIGGIETAKLLRSRKKTKNIPIIFITAHESDEYTFKGYNDAGAVDYLIKPLKPEIIISKINVFITLYKEQKKREEALRELRELKKELEEKNKELEYLATHDKLTGLANRELFEREIRKIYSAAKRHNRSFALFYVDIDKFKWINDYYGHFYADIILQEIAKKLKTNVREEDCVARIGGDEFALILTDLKNKENIFSIAQKLLELSKDPISAEDKTIEVSFSIGISCYPESTTDLDELVKQADIAMYCAKQKKGSSYQQFSEELYDSYTEL